MSCCGGLDFLPLLVAAATADFILVLHELPGRPLVQAIFDEAMPCTAESMIMLLDSLPPAVASLPRRPPWTGAVATYAEMIAAALPVLDPQLRWLVAQVSGGLAGVTWSRAHPRRLSRGPTVRLQGFDHRSARYRHHGPGRRADDLACMIAHLSTMQRMTAEQAAGLTRLINLWLQVFDTRVDPAELRLRAAGRHRLARHGPLSGPGTELGSRDRTHDRVGCQSGAERGAGLT